jgi:transcriptional regulator with XRE-family HTH domain
MKGRKKTPKVPGFMRTILAANLKKLLERDYRDNPNKPKALAADAGVSLSTVQRIVNAEVGASLDNIESIAAVFDLSPYQILVPNLEVKNPQVIKGATKEEELAYRRFQKARVSAEGVTGSPKPVEPASPSERPVRTI